MSKELYFTDGNNEVKYLDTTASFNLAITQDGSAFDLTNATAIDVKVANDTGYVFDKPIDMATIKQPLAGLITMPVDAEVMNALVPDDYTIEVWVTLSSLITPGSQEGLTDGATTDTTTSSTDTTTYNAIFPSDDPQGFTITENVMSDSGDVIPVMSLDDFQQEFDQLKTDLTNKVSTLQGPKGDKGDTGTVDNTGLISAPAFQSLQTQVDNSAVGTNLLTGTSDFSSNWIGQFSVSTTTECNGCPSMVFTSSNQQLARQQFGLGKLENSFQYTITFWAKADNAGDKSRTLLWGYINPVDFVLTTNWVRYTAVVTSFTDANTNSNHSMCFFGVPDGNKGNVYIALPKLEKGSVATDWCPNPSEILTQSDYAKIKAAIVALGGALS